LAKMRVNRFFEAILRFSIGRELLEEKINAVIQQHEDVHNQKSIRESRPETGPSDSVHA